MYATAFRANKMLGFIRRSSFDMCDQPLPGPYIQPQYTAIYCSQVWAHVWAVGYCSQMDCLMHLASRCCGISEVHCLHCRRSHPWRAKSCGGEGEEGREHLPARSVILTSAPNQSCTLVDFSCQNITNQNKEKNVAPLPRRSFLLAMNGNPQCRLKATK